MQRKYTSTLAAIILMGCSVNDGANRVMTAETVPRSPESTQTLGEFLRTKDSTMSEVYLLKINRDPQNKAYLKQHGKKRWNLEDTVTPADTIYMPRTDSTYQ
jgi:hypothetical protein